MDKTEKELIMKRKLGIKQKQDDCNKILSRFSYDPQASLSKQKKYFIPISSQAKTFRNQNQLKLPSITASSHNKNNNTKEITIKTRIPKLRKEPISFSLINLDKITFNQYLQMQTIFEMNMRAGANKTDKLLKQIDELSIIRKRVMEREIQSVLSLQGRYNDEYPEEDTKINLEDKSLIEHLWKNSYGLCEYQNFFLDELKGKISSLNYRQMLKKFRQITRICFNKGVVNIGSINYMLDQQ